MPGHFSRFSTQRENPKSSACPQEFVASCQPSSLQLCLSDGCGGGGGGCGGDGWHRKRGE